LVGLNKQGKTMSQQIENINIKDLVLWTENPRDPITSSSTDQDVASKAWTDDKGKWQLRKLCREMKHHYDFSELPTIVYQNNKPIVYDGNRRIILAKLKHNYVELEDFDVELLPDIPRLIPCNVCSEDIAIENIYRKHADSGSWSPLDRDLFLYKFRGEPKSTFLKFDESTNLISVNSHLNKGFVKKEILTNEKLREMGFDFNDNNELESKHTVEESKQIFEDISTKVKAKFITTRNKRGKIIEVLNKETRSLIEKNKSNNFRKIRVESSSLKLDIKKKITPRTKKKDQTIFNETLYIKSGQVSDLYRDIVDLYTHYSENKDTFSQFFPSVIRMALRLLTEAAAEDMQMKLQTYVQTFFSDAKKMLNQDLKTTLSVQNVTIQTMPQLLHIGAHNYQAGNDMNQTLAISIILGQILTLSHGK
jgi:hypothetical protein